MLRFCPCLLEPRSRYNISFHVERDCTYSIFVGELGKLANWQLVKQLH